MSNFIELQESEWESVLQKGDALLIFHAEWCGPCRMLHPILEKLSTEYVGKIQFVRLDVDHAQRTAGALRVTSVPTMVFFKGGKEHARIVGLRDAAAIKKILDA